MWVQSLNMWLIYSVTRNYYLRNLSTNMASDAKYAETCMNILCRKSFMWMSVQFNLEFLILFMSFKAAAYWQLFGGFLFFVFCTSTTFALSSYVHHLYTIYIFSALVTSSLYVKIKKLDSYQIGNDEIKAENWEKSRHLN